MTDDTTLRTDQLTAGVVGKAATALRTDHLSATAVGKCAAVSMRADHVSAAVVGKGTASLRAALLIGTAILNPPARVTQNAKAALLMRPARVSQVGTSALLMRPMRISQSTKSALLMRTARVTQFVLTALVFNVRLANMIVYPDRSILPGLTFDVVWSTTFHNMETQTTASGIDVDLAFSDIPTHDFELSYEFLRNSLTLHEEQILRGFFMAIRGAVGRFLFQNPKDNAVTGEAIGTTDGTATTYGPVYRTYGYGDYAGREPVGQINPAVPSIVYLDGVAQDPSTYAWVTATPCKQYLKFNTTPAGGQVITADFGFYYYCKFSDNTLDFKMFMENLWSIDSVKIHSCKAGG